MREGGSAKGAGFRMAVAGLGVLLLAGAASAAGEPTARGQGEFHNSVELLMDGVVPEEGSEWAAEGCVWWETPDTSFVFDFGEEKELEDMELQVDNNDDYVVEYSMDGKVWDSLMRVRENIGEVDWGMDTFSTKKGSAEYDASLDFDKTKTRFVRLTAKGGDGLYSASHIKFFFAPTAAPVPRK